MTYAYSSYSGGYSHGYRKQTTKIDWAGIGLGDAFKSNLEYYLRLPAQQMFYQTIKKVQETIVRQTGVFTGAEFKANINAQLDPCYTSYPSALAAQAAIGLSGFLEFKSRLSGNILHNFLSEYLADPVRIDEVSVEPETYKNIAQAVTDFIHTRLVLEDLSRLRSASAVEIYRLFLSSQQSLRFESLPEIIRAVVFFGDILPEWHNLNLHPLTRRIFNKLSRISDPFQENLPRTKGREMIDLGVRWVKAVCLGLAPFLPEPQTEKKEGLRADQVQKTAPSQDLNKIPQVPSAEDRRLDLLEEIPPLSGPNPPLIYQPSSLATRIAGSLPTDLTSGAEDPDQPDNDQSNKQKIDTILKNLGSALEAAGGRANIWEDIRSDILEQNLKMAGFTPSQIEGNPTDGHSLNVRLSGNHSAGGEIFDRPVALSENFPGYEQLLRESQPIIEAFRRALYPNISLVAEIDRFRTSGSLDPIRLAVAEFTPAIFRRNRIYTKASPKGSPVVLIAADGSGSLNEKQIRMLKILVTAWLLSTTRSRIQVLAGLYHSGQVRPGVSGPLVQWIHHPRKTPAISRKEAARALVSLPDSGTGIQSDALSLQFMLNEAAGLAKGRMIYLILISDCQWNQSFKIGKTGFEEVYSVLDEAYREYPGKLHTTLVALGVSGKTNFEGLLNKIILVAEKELDHSSEVAKKVGVYVASCLKARSKLGRK